MGTTSAAARCMTGGVLRLRCVRELVRPIGTGGRHAVGVTWCLSTVFATVGVLTLQVRPERCGFALTEEGIPRVTESRRESCTLNPLRGLRNVRNQKVFTRIA
jgi:hypothetical protein